MEAQRIRRRRGGSCRTGVPAHGSWAEWKAPKMQRQGAHIFSPPNQEERQRICVPCLLWPAQMQIKLQNRGLGLETTANARLDEE